MRQELEEREKVEWYVFMDTFRCAFSKRPDWGLFEAKREAEIECNGMDGGWIGVWGADNGRAAAPCSIGASIRWISNMYESAEERERDDDLMNVVKDEFTGRNRIPRHFQIANTSF